MAIHRMDPVDAAWYHMDGPANAAVVIAVAVSRSPLDFERVRRHFRRRLVRFARFRQRVVERGNGLASPHWEDVDELDWRAHMRHAALPEPGDDAALQAFVDELAGQPLDHARPLWQAVVVDKVGTGSALILRYHHCIGDGSAMMAVAATLFDMKHRAVPAKAVRGAPAGEPPGLLDQALMLAGEAGAVVADVLKWPDAQSPIKGRFGPTKRVAWSAPVPLEDVKTIGAPSGAKINDVLVAAVAGALRSYLRRRGTDVDHASLRAMVPVDLRPPERYGELGNEFGLVILELPVSEATAAARLALTQERMNALKHSAEGPAMRLLLDIFGRGPKLVEDLACEIFGSKASLVLTNVIGPQDTMRLCDAPIDRLMFCVPHPGDQIGMGVSILSYRRQVTLTVIADAALVPNPQAITQAFNREVDEMVRRARRAGAAAAAASGAAR